MLFTFFNILLIPATSYRIKLRPRIDQDLKNQLQKLYVDHTDRDYASSRRQMYGHTDCEYGALRLIYDTEFFGFTCGKEEIPSASFVNAEHVVPQSTFGKKRPMVSDLHHLISSPNVINNARSNYQFGEFDYSQCNKWCNKNNCKLPVPSDDQKDQYSCVSSSNVFMPRKQDRGEIARAVFYFYTVYPDYKLSTVGNVETFKLWNRLYPPSAFEIARNNAINRSQGNRNPFIDDPSLVDQVW
ncbi:hypothetical protein M9Y10_011340 [Tritrichomonas musculus]|uniref:Endonuclease I n=1 Tax=Tritrichomonas musculus TaxID=1915356 RepID=A0ABR2IKA9_9EUKA